MKKINVVLGFVLAFVIMFNVGVIMFEHGRNTKECEYTQNIETAYEQGRREGVNEYSQYVEEQKDLQRLNTVFGERLGYR